MEALRQRFEESSDFLCGVELVSTRGSVFEEESVRIRNFASELVGLDRVDWVSITDNAGGNPMLAPTALGRPILYAGKEVVIHLSCKDFNRNGLESEAWHLQSEGFHNILALTGDYPVGGSQGLAKPVFDIDSVALIDLLAKMNQGLALEPRDPGKKRRLGSTSFFVGAVVSNFKLRENEVIPQYLKLEKKVERGARFVISQIGYDSRKSHELALYLERIAPRKVPLIGNVYLLNVRVARLFHSGKIPGVVVSDELLERAEEEGRSADRGKAFFLEMAAKQVAVFRGLGYRGVYLGGLHGVEELGRLLEIDGSFSKDDWKGFAREIRFSRPGEFYLLAEDQETGLSAPLNFSPQYRPGSSGGRKGPVGYRLSRLAHRLLFTPARPLFKAGAALCRRARDSAQGPYWLRGIERASKGLLFGCKDCGDCSLPEIAYLCPESQCAKNQRNGPCGGTREGKCEVGEFECIWSRAYDRLKAEGQERHLLDHAPVIQDHGLRGTSSWANAWLGRDHRGREPGESPGAPAPSAPEQPAPLPAGDSRKGQP